MMHDHLDVGDRERGEGYENAQGKLQAGMEASGTASENSAKVTRRW